MWKRILTSHPALSRSLQTSRILRHRLQTASSACKANRNDFGFEARKAAQTRKFNVKFYWKHWLSERRKRTGIATSVLYIHTELAAEGGGLRCSRDCDSELEHLAGSYDCRYLSTSCSANMKQTKKSRVSYAQSIYWLVCSSTVKQQ